MEWCECLVPCGVSVRSLVVWSGVSVWSFVWSGVSVRSLVVWSGVSVWSLVV